MSQFDFATIDPNAKSGTQLAVDLNNWRDALHSCHRGAERPAYAQGGMLWVRETSAEQWDLMFYDGDTDFVLRSVNPTTNQLIGIPQSSVSGLAQVIADFEADLAGKQAGDPTLAALAGLATGVDQLPYFTGTDTAAQTTLTAFARTLLDDADAAAARATLGVPATADTMQVSDKRNCTAWVNFNGTGTVSIRDSYNVSSITDRGTGQYTVNFATAMNNASYSVTCNRTNDSASGTGMLSIDDSAAPNVNAVRVIGMVLSSNGTSGSLSDPAHACVQVFGGK